MIKPAYVRATKKLLLRALSSTTGATSKAGASYSSEAAGLTLALNWFVLD